MIHSRGKGISSLNWSLYPNSQDLNLLNAFSFYIDFHAIYRRYVDDWSTGVSVYDCAFICFSDEGRVRKVLKVEPLPDGSGHFFNLSNFSFLKPSRFVYFEIFQAY